MLDKSGLPINRRKLGFLIAVALILLLLVLPWILANLSSEDPGSFSQGEEGVGILKYPVEAEVLRTSWVVMLSGGATLVAALYMGFKRRESSNQSRFRLLILLAAISLALYLLHYLLPFPLHRYYNFKRVTMGWLTSREPLMAIGISVGIVTLFLLYYFAYRVCRGQNIRRLWAVVLLGALAFSAAATFVFNLTSTDVYDYVARGRITGVYGGNPYSDVPNDYPDDPIVQMAAWRKTGTAYGPLWEVLSGFIGRWAGDSLWNNVLAYKGLAWVSYLTSTLLVAAILRRVSPNHALAGTVLFAWNPLVLLEGVANLHNDMLMIALLLAGFWVLSHVEWDAFSVGTSRYLSQDMLWGILGTTLIGASILIKFIPALFLPLILMYVLSKVEGGKRRVGNGLALIAPIILLSLYYFQLFWEWPEITNAIIRRIEMFRMSISSVTKEMLQVFLRTDVARFIGSWLYLTLFAGGYGILLVRTHGALRQNQGARTTNPEESWPRWLRVLRDFVLGTEGEERDPWAVLLRNCILVLALYLLFGNPWFWPWYLIWPIALIALYQEARMVVLMIIVACTAELSHVLWNFVWYWLGTSWQNLYIVDILAYGLMLIPTLMIINALRVKRQEIGGF